MDAFFQFLDFLWSSFLLLAPMLLLGLFLAGLMHVLISREAILRWLRLDSLKSVVSSAAIGVPMPLCSCSVVPVVAEMRRKGASRSSCMSFLITAPETGADSILVTHAFFGPVAAVVRPVVSFMTGVVAGIFCIGLIRERETADPDDRHDHDRHDHDRHDHEHDGDHDHGHRALIKGADDCYVSPGELKGLWLAWLHHLSDLAGRVRSTNWLKPQFYRDLVPASRPVPSPGVAGERDLSTLSFATVWKHVLRYGFVDVADDILFALLVGLALGGLLYLAIPSDLMALEYARWLSYPVMVLAGIPLYICASASTPIAAALVAKGFSPGAALIFLMTGPATNTGTIAVICRQFGTRFASVYVGSVIGVTVALGVAIDLLVLALGLEISVNLEASDSPALMLVQWGGALGLVVLIVWRFRAGALKSGYEDLIANLRPIAVPVRSWWARVTRNAPIAGAIHPRAPAGAVVWLTLVAVFLQSGFTVVGPGEVGYGRLFGAAVWRDLPPGLHYLAPWPFAKADKWPVREVKSITCCDRHDFLTGDVNLMSIVLNVQYRVRDPYAYHYQFADPELVIVENVRKELRKFASERSLDALLNVEREPLQEQVASAFENPVPGEDVELLGAVELVRTSLVSVHPVDSAMNAFREVSSSQDDRERIIVNAQRLVVSLIPRAYGNAAYEVEQAKGDAARRIITSVAESDAIRAVAAAVREAPEVLHNMLWREKLEASLAGRRKIVVPSEETLNRIALWKSANGPMPATSPH